jgi:hypothetical protein
MTDDLPEPGLPAPEAIRQKARIFILQWIAQRQGSPAELIRALEEEVGWPARHCLTSILDELRASRSGPELDRKYGQTATIDHKEPKDELPAFFAFQFLRGKQAFGNVWKFRKFHGTDLAGKVHGHPAEFVPEKAIRQSIIRQCSELKQRELDKHQL